jgi:hypothetical protein
MAAGSDDDRLFVRDGFRHYRRRYSLAEVRWGLVCLAAMALIAGWVFWRGKHPADPNLFSDGTALLQGTTAAPVPTMASAPPATTAAAVTAPDRGPLPRSLAGPGWHEDKLAQFDPENLYVKIDGRADYFKAFGFRRLHSLLLVSDRDPSTTVDVEMYDLGRAANALGAYGGERAPDVKPHVDERGLWHIARNALYMARGPYYLRVIGSDETPAIQDKLAALETALAAAIPGEPLPWSYGLFVGGLGIDPGLVSYFVVNAFSFSFASDVWTARPRGKNDDLELFAAVRASAREARKLETALHKGFLGFGEAAGQVRIGGHDVPLIKDQLLGAFTAITTSERWVLGARGAASRDMLVAELGRLEHALAQTPAELRQQARPATAGSPDNDQPASAVEKGGPDGR